MRHQAFGQNKFVRHAVLHSNLLKTHDLLKIMRNVKCATISMFNRTVATKINYILYLNRGGVLEPEGTVEIRYRKKDLIKTMYRIDHVCKDILSKLSSPELSANDKKALETSLRHREEHLLPIYHQVALTFADLHDTPARMQEKQVIQVSDYNYKLKKINHCLSCKTNLN